MDIPIATPALLLLGGPFDLPWKNTGLAFCSVGRIGPSLLAGSFDTNDTTEAGVQFCSVGRIGPSPLGVSPTG